MILVGGGIYLLQEKGWIPDAPANPSFAGQSPLQNAVSQLEVIARHTHDYLNGYLAGSEWGTALPQEAMLEEIDQLQYEYEMIEEEVNRLEPKGTQLDSLFGEFFFGFEVLQGGLTRNNKELISNAHEIFHRIDYEIFHHQQGDELTP
jgi:hypothetical protein